MRLRFVTADVFTDRVFAGNPLAVVFAPLCPPVAVMQAVAREFNLSETVFVLPPGQTGHAAALRIFTPTSELPFAGHPTIGAAHALAATGRLARAADRATDAVLGVPLGPVPIRVPAPASPDAGDAIGEIWLTVPTVPTTGAPPPPLSDLAAALGLEPADLVAAPAGPRVASCGVPFLFVPLCDLAALGRARADPVHWPPVAAALGVLGVYPYVRVAERVVRARMFAPATGIPEDPATGSAAAAFAACLDALTGPRVPETQRWRIDQGHELGRPSTLALAFDRDAAAITQVRLGGRAVLVTEGTIDLP